MKIIIYLLFFPFLLNAQITTTKVTPQTETPKVQYDSTKNYLGENVFGYLNQELFLPHKYKDLRKYGWEGFSDDYPTESSWDRYDYDDLVDRYYFVTKIDKAKYGYGEYIFTLKEKEKGDTYYFEYSTTYEHKFPFITVSYFNYLKNVYVNNEYIVRGKTGLKDGPVTDINNGKIVDFSNGSEWKCIDLTLDSEYYALCLKLKNNKNENVLMSAENLEDRPDWIILKSKAEHFKQTYGDELWQTALDGKAKIGMTKELCEFAWGKPSKINKTLVSGSAQEQWVYGDGSNYLYFENGILTAIQ